MSRFLTVKGTTLKRDINSGAILNNDDSKRRLYKQMIEKSQSEDILKKRQEQKIQEIDNKINKLEEKLDKILKLLKCL
jgi:hypothetical protein